MVGRLENWRESAKSTSGVSGGIQCDTGTDSGNFSGFSQILATN